MFDILSSFLLLFVDFMIDRIHKSLIYWLCKVERSVMRNLTENEIKSIKKSVDYRGRNVKFKEFRAGMSLNSYWDSGSRDYFYFINLASGSVRTIPQNGTPFDKLSLKTDNLPPNEVLVEKVVMRGKNVAVYIYS